MDMYILNKDVYNMLKQKESENNTHKLNLDKRLTHNPFTIFDVEECEKYIGKEGLFSDSAYNFKDIKKCSKGTLTNFNMMAKARIAQYGYIPNPDPWRDLNE